MRNYFSYNYSRIDALVRGLHLDSRTEWSNSNWIISRPRSRTNRGWTCLPPSSNKVVIAWLLEYGVHKSHGDINVSHFSRCSPFRTHNMKPHVRSAVADVAGTDMTVSNNHGCKLWTVLRCTNKKQETVWAKLCRDQGQGRIILSSSCAPGVWLSWEPYHPCFALELLYKDAS